MTCYAHPMRPESRGHIHIVSSDPRRPPAINFNFLSSPVDAALARRPRPITRVPELEKIEREARLGPAADARERERLANLLGCTGTLDELNRELARQLRAGQRDERDAILMAHLEATIADKIAIANPKWR